MHTYIHTYINSNEIYLGKLIQKDSDDHGQQSKKIKKTEIKEIYLGKRIQKNSNDHGQQSKKIAKIEKKIYLGKVIQENSDDHGQQSKGHDQQKAHKKHACAKVHFALCVRVYYIHIKHTHTHTHTWTHTYTHTHTYRQSSKVSI